MIKVEDGKTKYFDRNGAPIVEGCKIRYLSGRVEQVYLTADGELGVDATNPRWVETGRAVPCEYGIYPLTAEDTDDVEVIAE